jgi:hypothetical protein
MSSAPHVAGGPKANHLDDLAGSTWVVDLTVRNASNGWAQGAHRDRHYGNGIGKAERLCRRNHQRVRRKGGQLRNLLADIH